MTRSDNFEQQVLDQLDKLTHDVDDLKTDVKGIKTNMDTMKTDADRFNERFTYYQQATQCVVQLAFTLIASATITVIVTSVLRR